MRQNNITDFEFVRFYLRRLYGVVACVSCTLYDPEVVALCVSALLSQLMSIGRSDLTS